MYLETMHTKETSLSNSSVMPTALYTSEQIYAMEQAWFAEGYNSFALMQQAAWQMTQRIIEIHYQTQSYKLSTTAKHALIWVGQGNNGGDGWLIALYLQQIGWQVKVITVDTDTVENSASSEKVNENAQALEPEQLSDAFDLVSDDVVDADLKLNQQDLKNLIAMTPYAYKAKQERREALEAQTAFELQAQYQILLFQKKA